MLTTDGQSASVSCCQAPIWGLRPDFYYCQTVAGLSLWGALCEERMGLPFTVAAGPRQCSLRGSEYRGTRDHILLSQIQDSPNLEGQVPVCISASHWIPFSSPPTTRRPTVEAFESASTRGLLNSRIPAQSHE
jgi:hypothetical protein